ncbi:MAG TPA: hypothetical protein VMH91_00955 [Candidatus Paceibacterota bacterium]|nr:hypothetical protein [Candidatus Paceibacterota bacterium]
MLRTLIALVCGGILLAASPALAQQVNFTGTTALTISASPAHPGPNSTVELTAESPLLDLAASDIKWDVNGSPVGSGQSVQVKLGSLGQRTDVVVSVSGGSGNDSAEVVLVPTSIDLLWEADSYVPPFYLGRALPGSGSAIRLLAIPHFVRPDGSEVASSGITYTWKVNGAVLKAQSGVGESSVVVPAAILYGSDTVTVDAATTGFSGEASVVVRTGDPQLVLYDDSPLFGILYHRALGSSSGAAEAVTSFAAVPYFVDAPSPNDPNLAYAWSVNGSAVTADPQDPSELTINAQSQGIAQVELSVSKPSDPFFSASGAWQVAFSAAGAGAGGTNVFH